MKLMPFLYLAFFLSGCAPAAVQPTVLAAAPTATVSTVAEEIESPTPSPVPLPTPATVPAAAPTPIAVSEAITGSEMVAVSDFAEGIQVYQKSYCGICHTLDAAGTRGVFAPEHNHMGTVAAERILSAAYTGAATTAADYIRESIVEPRAYLVEEYRMSQHNMPAYTNLTTEEVDALVNLLLQQH